MINIKSPWIKQAHQRKKKGERSGRNMNLFAYEGVLLAVILAFINNNNNLFATRLGASDFQLSLLNGFPQLVALIVLLPGGILTDRMPNKKRMVTYSLIALCFVYLAIGFSPAFGKYRFYVFLTLLSLSVGPMTIYNASWQAYFSDTVPARDRNKIFTLRTKWTFFINIAAPLLTGFLLARAETNSSKLIIHSSLFWASCVFIILQIFVLKRISGGNSEFRSNISFKDLKEAAIDLAHNKKFIVFWAVALFFYMSWQSDWTLFYIGQVQYLKLDEAWISYMNVGIAAAQFFTIGFWSRVNEKLGIRFAIILGSVSLCLFPIIMIISTSLSYNTGHWVFVILCTLNGLLFATVSLNIMQCLLQVIPEKNKTLSIAIYTMFVTISNGIMPMVGVKVYSSLGSNLKAFQTTFMLIFITRLIATGLWIFRWWSLRKDPK